MSASLPAPAPELLPGVIIGNKYRVDGFLGEGGMGVVLSATHLELDSAVAIKVVREELAEDEHAVENLLFEARAAARMRGAHIVRVLDVGRLDTGAPYVVMEQLRGWDLGAELVANGALSASLAASYLLQACEGLAEAHALGIIHRDLKPANLFVAETHEGPVLKVLDFGISKNVGAAVRSGPRSTLTKSGLAVGSPYYMSPEQMRALPNLDARADIWSLGAILFELLTGRCPFEGEKPAEICAKVLTTPTPSLFDSCPGGPEELDVVIHCCLQKDPNARYQTVTELADALRHFMATQAASATKLEESEVAPVRRRSRKGAVALVAMSALLVSAGVVFWQLGGSARGLRWLDGPPATAAELPSKPSALPARTAEPVPEPAMAVAPSPVTPVERSEKPSVAGPAAPRSWPRPTASPTAPTVEIAPIAAVPLPAPVAPPGLPASDRPPATPLRTPDHDSVGQRYDL
jgi:serine/threonine-protein kinase